MTVRCEVTSPAILCKELSSCLVPSRANMSTKRKKISGLTGIELLQTVNAIKTLLAKWEAEQVDEAGQAALGEADDDSDVDQLRAVLNMLTTRMDSPQVWVHQTCKHSRAQTSSNLDLLVL